MPGFISHTIMAKDVYNKLNKKNVSLDYFLTYSIGGDLCKYAKCRYASHHKDQDLFISNMVKYIKDNNLTKNKDIIGLLYGHISHHIMDNTIHPLVKRIDNECITNKHNHSHIEEYYDILLTKDRFNKNRKEYLHTNLLNTKSNNEINKMLDYVYLKTYHTKNVSKYYIFNLFLYRILRRIYLLFGDNFINNISGLNSFIKRNNRIKLDNSDNTIKYKDYKRTNTSNSLIDCYNESITRTIKYIDSVNKELNIWQMFVNMIIYIPRKRGIYE